jgi:NaMN:DMB phosphoribosyltransferase
MSVGDGFLSQVAAMVSSMRNPARPRLVGAALRDLVGEAALATTVATYDGLAAEYANRVARADLAADRLRFERALTGSTLPLLDAGCGAGRDCSLFEQDHLSPIGIDLSGAASQRLLVTPKASGPI